MRFRLAAADPLDWFCRKIAHSRWENKHGHGFTVNLLEQTRLAAYQTVQIDCSDSDYPLQLGSTQQSLRWAFVLSPVKYFELDSSRQYEPRA